MLDADRYQPQDYGLEQTERNARLIRALITGKPVMVVNDTGDVATIAKTLQRASRFEGEIRIVELTPHSTPQQIELITGIELLGGRYRIDDWKCRQPNLVIAHLDDFVFANQEQLEIPNSEPDRMFQTLLLAQR